MRGVEEHTVTGTLELFDRDAHYALDGGDFCEGDGGYNDLESGAQVVISDGEGRTLSTARLSTGEYDGLSCVFSFRLVDVPRAAFYAVTVAGENRGQLTYSYDGLSDQNWSLSLTLGLD